MPASAVLPPTHLAIFVTDPGNGNPVQRLPLYAEVAVPRIIPRRPPASGRLLEPIISALFDTDPDAAGEVRTRVENASLAALGQVLTDAALASLPNLQVVRDLFLRVFKEVLVAAGVEHIVDIPASQLEKRIEDALRAIAPRFDLAVTETPEETEAIWSEPLGVLTTDHVGYASFDLTRLRPDVQVQLARAIARRVDDPDATLTVAIWVYPYGEKTRYEVLSQARFAFGAVVARLEKVWHTLPPNLINMGPRALQNPSLTDWRLSPASFAASPKTLVGEGGCEELVPSNLALRQFVLRQVVRLTDPPEDFRLPRGYKAAYVDDYKVSWFSLGHSLGEILYSLPLAPGETVKLAVIDWSWDSLTQRAEKTSLTEDILHQTHRDRTITETVRAGLQELQKGSSFMAGGAGASGASGGASSGGIGLGAAVGNAWSIGGSTATSQGSRDLAAENVQRVNDSFAQASSAQRELNSTIVIQARQEEKQSIQTRTFSNYNHSHTLTILYYEVLRHFRVTVEWIRRRPAVLVKMKQALPAALTAQVVLARRYLLEPYLLDRSLAAAFDAAGRVTLGEEKLKRETSKWAANTVTIDPGAKSFNRLVAQFTTTGDDSDEPVFVVLHLHDGRAFEFQCDGAAGEGTSPEFEKVLPIPVTWSQIKGVEVKLKDTGNEAYGDWEESNILVSMVTPEGERVGIVADATKRLLDDDGGTTGLIPAAAPPPATTTPVGPKPQRNDFVTVEDDVALQGLLTHIELNRTFYNGVLVLATDPNVIGMEFEAVSWPPTTMDDHVEPTPLDVFGSYVAYPLVRPTNVVDDSVVVDIAAGLSGTDPLARQRALDQLAALNEADRASVLDRLPLASARSERLITLPTRGVFAEGKLGHCNVSEEIDNTRFWKWEEHPIPVQAPDIGTVTPVTPAPQAVDASPTAFPNSLVNIVNPTAAPDPSGLAPALNLLATANIFRDMSGREQVADLLKTLSNNAVRIAEVAVEAQKAATAGGPGGGGGGSGSGAGSGQGGGSTSGSAPPPAPAPARKPEVAPGPPPRTPEERDREQIDNGARKIEKARELLPPKDQAKVRQDVLANEWSNGRRWTVALTSHWEGKDVVHKPMKAWYVGEIFLAGEESVLLNPTPYATDQVSKWDNIVLKGEPVGISLLANEVEPYTDQLSINIPGITIDGLVLKEKTYAAPLRTNAGAFPVEMRATVGELKVPAGSTAIRLQGTAMLATKSIEITLQFDENGEISGDITRALTEGVTIEKLLEVGVALTLKGGVKVNVGAHQGIKGTFDLVYFVGWSVKQLT